MQEHSDTSTPCQCRRFKFAGGKLFKKSSECIAQLARYQLDHLSQTFSWLLGMGEEGCLPILDSSALILFGKYILK